MTATLLNRAPHSVSEISAEIFTIRRSYFDLVQEGQQFENFFKQYESAPETLEQIRSEFASVFVDSCLAIAHLDPTLEASQRDRLSKLKFRFIPAEDTAKLLKLPSELREKCLAQLERIEFSRFLPEDSLKKVIKQVLAEYRPPTLTKIPLGEPLHQLPLEKEKLSKKLGVDSLQFEELLLDLEAQHNISVTTTAVIDVCYEHGLSSLEQLKKALRSPEFADWLIDKAQQLRQDRDLLQEEKNTWNEQKSELIQELRNVKQQLTTNKARTAQQEKIEETKSYKSHHPASMQTPQPLTKYHKGARVGIVTDGQIINEGVMIGQPTEGHIRVRFKTGGSDLFVFDDLMLLSPTHSQKTGEKTRKKPKGFGY